MIWDIPLKTTIFSEESSCDTTQIPKEDFYPTRTAFWENTSFGQISYKTKTFQDYNLW